MRRVTAANGDVFEPVGQLAKELALAAESPGEVARILRHQLSPDRIKRIDTVIAHRTRRLTVAIEGVNDPHNTAAVIRTADAFGLQNVHVIERGGRFLSSRRVTQGTHKWVDLGVWPGAEQFYAAVRKEGKRVLIADAAAATPLAALSADAHLALVFGNEHEGVSAEMRDLADGAFSIPLFGFATSVNVSVAAAITIAHVRQRAQGDLSPEEREILRARFYLRAVRAGYDIVKRELASG